MDFDAKYESAKERSYRDSTYLPNYMTELYNKVGPEDRLLYRKKISEWLFSNDGGRRYVAFWMIDELSLTNLVSDLIKFSQMPEDSYPMYRFDRKKALRLIEQFQD